MKKLITGAFQSGKTAYALNAFLEGMSQDGFIDPHFFFIVPSRDIKDEIQRRIVRASPRKGVLGLQTHIITLAECIGYTSIPQWVLRSLVKELVQGPCGVFFEQVRAFDGFITLMTHLMHELYMYRVRPQDIRLMPFPVPDKGKAIEVLYSAYCEKIHALEQQAATLRKTSPPDFTQAARIVIDGCAYFSPLEIAFLACLPCPIIVTLPVHRYTLSVQNQLIAHGFITQRLTDAAPQAGRRYLFKASSPREEFIMIAEEIRRLVAEEGYQYSDIIVIHRDCDQQALLKDVFIRADIPCCFHQRRRLIDSPLVRQIIRAQHAASSDENTDEKIMETLYRQEQLTPRDRAAYTAYKKVAHHIDLCHACGFFSRIEHEDVCRHAYYDIPHRLTNTVHVYDIQETGPETAPIVFIVSLLEKVFPKPVWEHALVKDTERAAFNRVSKNSLPLSVQEGIQREQFLFDRALSRSRDRLYMSYPVYDFSGNTLQPSFFLQDIDMTDIIVQEKESIIHEPVKQRDNDGITIDECDTALKEQLVKDHYTCTELDQYLRCPYAYFCQYVLRLGVSPQAQQYMERGTIMHRIAKRLIEARSTEPDIIRIIHEEVAVTAAGQTQTMRYMLEKELATVFSQFLIGEDELYSGNPLQPRYLEHGFSCMCGHSTVTGRIDRIDVDGKQALVIDYKSGSQTLSVQDVSEKKTIQLPLYAFVIEQQLGLQVFGMQIVSLKKQERTGIYDAARIEAYFPSFKKKRKGMMDAVDIQHIIAAVPETVTSIIQAIQQGIFPKKSDECAGFRYQCDYYDICRCEKE